MAEDFCPDRGEDKRYDGEEGKGQVETYRGASENTANYQEELSRVPDGIPIPSPVRSYAEGSRTRLRRIGMSLEM
jgi:hypothetical protein